MEASQLSLGIVVGLGTVFAVAAWLIGALLVGVAAAVEGRGRRFSAAAWLSSDEVAAVKKALIEYLRGEKSARYLM